MTRALLQRNLRRYRSNLLRQNNSLDRAWSSECLYRPVARPKIRRAAARRPGSGTPRSTRSRLIRPVRPCPSERRHDLGRIAVVYATIGQHHRKCSTEVQMADDLSNRGNQDRSRVNIHEKWELDYWTKWGVTRDHLVAAAKEVGVSVAAIAKKLGKKP